MNRRSYPGAPRDIDEAARKIYRILFPREAEPQSESPALPPSLNSADTERALHHAKLFGYDPEMVMRGGPEAAALLEGIRNYHQLDRDQQGRLVARLRGLREEHPELHEAMTTTLRGVIERPYDHVWSLSDDELLEAERELRATQEWLRWAPGAGVAGAALRSSVPMAGPVGSTAALLLGGMNLSASRTLDWIDEELAQRGYRTARNRQRF